MVQFASARLRQRLQKRFPVPVFVCLASVNPEIAQDLRYRALQQDAAVIHDDAVVHQTFHVLDDMGSQEDGLALGLGIFPQVIHEQAAVTRVETQGEIVQDQEVGILGKDKTQGHLRTLPAGHVGDTLSRRNFEFCHQFIISILAPLGIKGRIETFYLADGHELVLHMAFYQQPDSGSCGRIHAPDVLAENQAFALAGLQIAAQDIDRGGLACPVLAQKPQNPAFGHFEIQVFVNEPFPVEMGQVPAFYDGFHKLHD